MTVGKERQMRYACAYIQHNGDNLLQWNTNITQLLKSKGLSMEK